MRIISLLPATTEILYALGSGDEIVGRSYDCDYPLKAGKIPILVHSIIKQILPSYIIDKKVSKALNSGQSLYKIEQRLFASLKPDLVITQNLCEVCSITPTNIQEAARLCRKIPRVLSLHPHSIKEIFGNIVEIGKYIGKERQAKKYVDILLKRVETIRQKTQGLPNRPRVYCMEWLDPPYNAGHWVKEQVEIAGGRDDLSTRGDSVRILWKKIAEYDPEVLILIPCGFSISRTRKELSSLPGQAWKLSAFKNGQVYLVNGPAYFNCSGPRVVDGIELLTHILHPEIFPNHFTKKDFQKL